MSTSRSARHRAREVVVQGLYQWQMGGQDEAAIQVQTESVPGYDKADGAMFRELLHITLQHAADTQATLSRHITRAWTDVSPIEAIELAKTFGGTDGHRFINGVLDKVAPELRADEVAQK